MSDFLGGIASRKAIQAVNEAEKALENVFAGIEAVELENTARVLSAFREFGVGQRHFAPTSGYGYDDVGRDTLDKVFAYALGAEDALVRPQLTSGTHTLFTALSGLVSSGDDVLSATGLPYDTMLGAVGITGDAPGSLKNTGVSFRYVDLNSDGKIDVADVIGHLADNTKVVYLQRSRGYAWRDSLLPADMEQLCSAVHSARPNTAVMVDNCYGEFTGTKEPLCYGANIIAGSLIKNPGGGMAPTGGYIAGKSAFIDRIQHKLTVPGMGREVGSYAGSYQPFYQGLFMAPHVTAQALKTAALFAKLFEYAGLETLPASDAVRSDIVQAVKFGTPQGLVRFCQSIQAAAPVDSLAVPEPWDMPGYDHQVIMAAGSFVSGSSIELSADGPMCEPYTAYIQGALTYAHGRLAACMAMDGLMKEGIVL